MKLLLPTLTAIALTATTAAIAQDAFVDQVSVGGVSVGLPPVSRLQPPALALNVPGGLAAPVSPQLPAGVTLPTLRASGNLSDVDQQGVNHTAIVTQAGQNAARLVQRGSNNMGMIAQSGGGNRAVIFQSN